jgi:transcription initiation factor TFIIIB Brf1 subunit/transcription initiation factor TFIIB
MQRLGKWLKFDYTDIVMFETLDLFNNAVAEMRLSSYIAQNSAKIYKEIFLYKQDDKKMILRGKNKSAVLAVCFYEISKTEIGLSDILNFFKIDLKVFDKTRRLLQGYNLISNQIEVFSKEYIHRICNKLNLHIKVIDLVCKIYEYVSFSDIQITTDHQILAYSVIYFVLTEMDDKIFIDNMKNIYKLNIDYVIKNHFILVKNKIRIFNHIKQNK